MFRPDLTGLFQHVCVLFIIVINIVGFMLRVAVQPEGGPAAQSQVICSIPRGLLATLQCVFILTVLPVHAEEKLPWSLMLPIPCWTVEMCSMAFNPRLPDLCNAGPVAGCTSDHCSPFFDLYVSVVGVLSYGVLVGLHLRHNLVLFQTVD